MLMNKAHAAVKHPFATLNKGSNKFMDWVADRVLASPVMFYTALVAPLIVLPMSDVAKLILAVLSSNWIQWWALPALQRRSNDNGRKQDLQADAIHQALTYLANKADRLESILLHPSSTVMETPNGQS